MIKDDIRRYLQSRDGQSQGQRLPSALDPFFAKLDEKTRKDLLDFAVEYAGLLNYYDTATNEISGDWGPLLAAVRSEHIARLKGYGGHEPHIALYLSFILLLKHAQKYLNTITGRHLDFYYRSVLGFANRGPVPDSVHVLFDLKKNVTNQLIEAGTLLKAGKDSSGKELLYCTTENIIVNTSMVQQLRSVFHDEHTEGVQEATGPVRIAPVANSKDGLGGELDAESPKWSPFGHAELPTANIGFALASPVLRLREGVRTITVTLFLSGQSPDASALANSVFSVYLTGEQGLIGPKQATLKKDGASSRYSFTITLEKDDDPVINYSPDVHGGSFSTDNPLMQIFIDNDHAAYLHFKDSTLTKARIDVDVQDVKQISILNDMGKLDPKKPFMPFGPSPGTGSHFYFGCDELDQKKITGIKLKVFWNIEKQKLADFYGYIGKIQNTYFTANLISPDGTPQYDVDLFDSADARNEVDLTVEHGTEGKGLSQSKGLAYTQRDLYSILPLHHADLPSQRKKIIKEVLLKRKIKTKAVGKERVRKRTHHPEGGMKNHFALSLNRDFYHKRYLRTYTATVAEFAKGTASTITLPAEPYTPVIQTMTFGYSATSGDVPSVSNDVNELLNSGLEFFHIGTFGQRREHSLLKPQLDVPIDLNIYLLPQYREAGEFYIGLSGIEPAQILCLLVQVAEGSANPEKNKVDVQWSVLCDDHWRPLKDTELLADTTNGLLTSGIVKLTMPDEATNDNTLLPTGLYWLRASVDRDTDAVCQVVDVKTNAVLAVFQDQGNVPSHLRHPLPAGSIRKASEQIASIKSITQPFSSSGGRMAEDDSAFYTRVSERLRHKHRSVAAWDYERIVLEQFPSLYKVKCLNHSSKGSLRMPGDVTVVVIPDIKNMNAVNPLQPKADKNTLWEIETCLKRLSSMFVRFHIQNPEYEQIQVSFSVKFVQGFEFGFYKEELNQEIKRFLSPWAYEKGRDIAFGGQIHKSVLIDHIEELPYVDYLTEFKMFHIAGDKTSSDQSMVATNDPRAILVSSESHTINPV